MKLKAVQSLPSIKLAGRVPGDLYADLAATRGTTARGRGEPIARRPLGVQMLQTFMGPDRAFRAWRRQHRSCAEARVDGKQSDGRESR